MSETVQEKPIQRVLRLMINLLVIIIVGIAIFLAWDRFLRVEEPVSTANEPSLIEPTFTQEEQPQSEGQVALPDFDGQVSLKVSGIYRAANLTTNIPTRPRVDVITYTVETGDSLFSIADAFNLKPETLLWGNYSILKDDPHVLRPGQVLNVLPIDGTYYQWDQGDNLGSVNKTCHRVEGYREAIRLLHRHGITVQAGIVFGFDGDGPDVFQRTLETLDELEVDVIQVSIFTPLPGTPRARLLADRIFDFDWAHYDFHRVVFEPEKMSPRDLQAGHDWVTREFYRPWRIVRRLRRRRASQVSR